MFEFAAPWLFLLIPIPFLFRLLVSPIEKQQAAVKVPFARRVIKPEIELRRQSSSLVHQPWLLWLIWLCLICALARPQWVGEPTAVSNSGRDLLLAVDISGSMKIEDMQIAGESVTRLAAVKKVVGEFVIQRKSDRLGLILFGAQAYLQAPLTYDRNTVNNLLQETEIGFAGLETAIGDAIGIAVKRLRTRPDNQRVLIILTDGANTAGQLQPTQAAELAQKEHIKIYTIGFGADEMVVNQGLFGSQVVNPSADLDETTMKSIAEKTGGQYFRARSIEELAKVHEALNQLEPIEQNEEKYRPVVELFYWPLSAVLFISLLWGSYRYLNFALTNKEAL